MLTGRAKALLAIATVLITIFLILRLKPGDEGVQTVGKPLIPQRRETAPEESGEAEKFKGETPGMRFSFRGTDIPLLGRDDPFEPPEMLIGRRGNQPAPAGQASQSPVENPPPGDRGAGELLQLKLKGVIIGKPNMAIIELGDGRIIIAREGDPVAGLRVVAIDRSSALLRGGERDIKLRLEGIQLEVKR